MSSSESPQEGSDRPRRPHEDENNPFIAFRRHVDDQITSMMNTLVGLPSAIYQKGEASERARQQRYSEHLQRASGPEPQATPQQDKKIDEEEDSFGKRDRWATNFWEGMLENDKIAKEMYQGYQQGKERWMEQAERMMGEADKMREEMFGRSRQTQEDGAVKKTPITMAQVEAAARAEEASTGSHGNQDKSWSWFWEPHDAKFAGAQENHAVENVTACPYLSLPEERVTECPYLPSPELRTQRGGIADSDRGTENDPRLQHPLPGRPHGASMSCPIHDEACPPSCDLHHLIKNPYSPLQLERHPRLGFEYGTQFRDAFEDLMRSRWGDELTTREEWIRNAAMQSAEWAAKMLEEYGTLKDLKASKTQQPQHEWFEKQLVESPTASLWDLIKRDSDVQEEIANSARANGCPAFNEDVKEETANTAKANGCPAFNEEAREEIANTARVNGCPAFNPKLEEDEHDTEQDMYERTFADFYKPVQAQQAAPAKDGKPSILATLTTTERQVLPDGSTTTRVVLKKRFADGREESSETLHQTPATGLQVEQKRLEQPKRKGWFWSE
ncbi:hypothetical protein LTS18_012751 [Coniosporium uncinatum]|uniref:Uncharacterized protein n=1 Tax=Coniosporium uncinatum TaxID=93489 RepID=A0ACC3DVK2_9PEZI|nr:hypothetical protein LTS18_012751 [Coniosporium uncinatum]